MLPRTRIIGGGQNDDYQDETGDRTARADRVRPRHGCGADAATINHRSIGTFKGVLFGTGTASVAKGDTTVTVLGGTIPANVGRGDAIVIDDEELYILSRDSDAQFTLQSAAEGDHVDDEFAVRRAYTSIQSWVNDRNGNLVREDRLEVGVLYNDGPFTVKNGWVMAWIHGSRTDPEHFMWLTAAEEARHKGVAGTGVVLDGRDRTRTGIIVEDDYTRIDGIELKRFGHWLVPAAVTVRGAMGVVLERLIIHDFDTDRRPHESYGMGGAGQPAASPCATTSSTTAARRGSSPARRTADVEVENCTIYGMRGRGVDEGLGRMSVVEHPVHGQRGRGFRDPARQSVLQHLLGRHGRGERSLTFLHPVDQFVSVQKGLEDFHLLETADAIDAGKNLAPLPAVARTGVTSGDNLIDKSETVDIDGTDRSRENRLGHRRGRGRVGARQRVVRGRRPGRRRPQLEVGLRHHPAGGRGSRSMAMRSGIKEGMFNLSSEIVISKPIALYGGFAGNSASE